MQKERSFKGRLVRCDRGIQMVQFNDQLSASELSSREREILEWVAQGMSAKEIAKSIGIAPRTVERHIENVRHKLRARNKTHMIAKAVALDLLHCKSRKAERLPRQRIAPSLFE